MSTRCLIGAGTDAGIRMVYVHSDGHPEGHWGRIEVLQRLVEAHGLDRVAATLLQKPAGWVTFDDDPAPDEPPTLYSDPEMYEIVPGFGVRILSGRDYYTPDTVHEQWDAEFIYLIDTDGELRWSEGNGRPWLELMWNSAGRLH